MKSRLILALAALLMLSGCKSKMDEAPQMSYNALYGYEKPAAPDTEEFMFSEDEVAGADSSFDLGRKVIFDYDYTLETKDMTATLAAMEGALAAGGGYISDARYGGRGDDGQYEYANLVFRVPTAAAGFFKNAVEAAGSVRSKNESGRDVTDEYFDTEARLIALTTQETRLIALLEQSGKLSDLLEIERELAGVRTNIERLTGTLRKYDNLVDLATFTIYVSLVNEYTPEEAPTFFASLGMVAADSLRTAGSVAKALLFVLIYLLPYLAAGALIWLAAAAVLRRRRKRRPVGFSAAPDETPESPPVDKI